MGSTFTDSEFGRAAAAAHSLILFDRVVRDAIGAEMVALSAALAAGDIDGARRHYRRAFHLLADKVELGQADPGDAWQQHLVDRLLADENPFSRKCEQVGRDAVGAAIVAATRLDLAGLGALHALCADALRPALGLDLPSWAGFRPRIDAVHLDDEAELRARLAESSAWPDLVDRLAGYFESRGAGVLARYRAFRWVGGREPIEIVEHPDPVRLADLIGYEVERELVVRNTVHFVAGHAANNVLLYGDRGTGKSSTVKALLNEFSDRGLRLIEVPKARLGDLPAILGLLRRRRERFILFVDDLSFDDNESHYRDLKAVLEGSIEARPGNVLLYATSNRRHLVLERFSDRGGPLDEIHAGDTSQEKLSFSDRFGIAVTFGAPDQDRYLAIVAGLARARGIALPPDDLRRRALEWATWQNGRSARTARQFIDFTAGELGMPAIEG